MKYCPKCKTEFPQETRFCSNCGAPLIELVQESEEQVPLEERAQELWEDEEKTISGRPEELEPAPAFDPAPILSGEDNASGEPEEEPTVRARPAAPAFPEPVRQTEYREPHPSEQPIQRAEYYEPYPPEQPEQIYAAPPAAPGKPPRVRKKVRVWRRLLAAFLCLFLFVFLLTPALLYSFRRTTGEAEGLKSMLDDIDLAEIPAAEIYDDVDDEDITLAEIWSENYDELPLDLMETVMDNSGVKDFAAEQVSAFLKDIYNGKTKYKFNTNDLIDVLSSSKINRALAKAGYPQLDDNDFREIADALADQGFEDQLSTKNFKSENPDAYKLINYAFGYPALIALLILALATAILIVAVNRGRVDLSLGDIGGTTLAVGLVLSAFAAFTKYLPDAWLNLCQGKTLIAQIASSFCMYNIKFYLILFAVGLVLAIIGAIIRSVKAVEE